MDANESLKSAIDRLQTMASGVGQFIADSERVFLGTGSKLQQLDEEANRLLTKSSGAIGMGDSTDNPAESLRKGLGRLDEHLSHGQEETEKGVRALTSVLAGIQNLSCLEGDFQRIVATLHALASTTHLENSRTNMGRAGFDSVVNDLRTMAVHIKPKFNQVLSQSRMVRTTAESALLNSRSFLERHRRDVSGLRKETQAHLAVTAAACNTSYVLANRSTESVAKVRSSVGKVLQSLQIQDIARQMFEHVVENLVEFATSAQQAMAAAPPTDDPRAWLAELAIVSRVEGAQLGNACDRLATGLSQIDTSLQSIVSTLAALAKESSTFSGKGNPTSILHQLERGIRATTKTLREHDRHESSLMAALGNVSETAVGVEALVGEVAKLGRDAKFIGLNAMVKAVHVGSAGATLTVLAREVQQVSDQIEVFTSSAATIMKTVGKEAALLVSTSTRPAGSGPGKEEAAADLERLMTELGTYQGVLASVVDRLLAGSGQLRSQVATISADLHGLMEKTKQLRRFANHLDDIHRLAAMGAGGVRPPASRQHTENRRHTMEQERQVQRVALHAQVPASSVEISKSADETSSEGSIEFF